jgi:delta-like protein
LRVFVVDWSKLNEGGVVVGSELLFKLTIQQSVDAGQDWLDAQPAPGSSRGQLRVAYRVRCDPGYYGTRCALSCNARQDKFGHYACSDNGSRTCLDGWTGDFCDVGKLTA